MAIDIGTSFNVQTNLALDERMVLTTEEMLNMNDNIMPDVYMATNKDDGKFYLYNKANDIDAATGKFRLMKSEGGALVFTKDEWEALDPKPAEGTQVIISDDTTPGGSENIIDDDATDATDKTWSAKKINTNLGEKVDKDKAVVKSLLKIESTNGTMQIIPWTDGTHYRSIDGNNGNDYTDIITKDGTAHLVKVKNGEAIEDEELATMNNVVKVTKTTFINSSNIVYKQGRMCTATIMNMLLNKTYSSGEIIGYIGNPACYPMEGIRGLVVQLNGGQASEIRINSDGSVQVGQATSLTPGYWVGNFSWITK